MHGTPAVHAPGSMTQGVRDLREEGIPLRTTLLRSGAHGTFALPTGSFSQVSAHVARHDGAAGRRKTARREEVVGSVDERSAIGARPRRSRTLAGAVADSKRKRESARSRNATTRKGMQRAPRHAPVGDVDGRDSPGGASRRSANRATAPARERISSSVGRARASFIGCRIRISLFRLPFECRKADRAASAWWSTRSCRKTWTGSCCKQIAGNESEEGISDRPKPLSSRGAVEAVSILRSPRKLTFNGGSVIRRVTGCQRRSRERNEPRARKGPNPSAREGEYPSSLPHDPPKRVTVRRETTDPSIAPHASAPHGVREADQARSKIRSAGAGSGSEWLAEVGRTHRDIHVRAWVPSPREVAVALNAHVGTSKGEPVCGFPEALLTDAKRRIRLARESVRGPFTTEGVLGRSNVRSSPGVR